MSPSVPVLRDPTLRAELADLAPRMASYWTLEAEAGVPGAQQLADVWTKFAFQFRADVVAAERLREQHCERDLYLSELVAGVRKAQGRRPDGSVPPRDARPTRSGQAR